MNRKLFLAAGLAAFLVGCASPARFLERGPTGGVVSVPDYTHRDDALDLIHDEIGPNARIVDETEVVTGTDQKTVAEAGTGSVFTRLASWFTGTTRTATTETKTTKATEWHIRYTTSP